MTRKCKGGYWAKITKRKEMGRSKERNNKDKFCLGNAIMKLNCKLIKVEKREQNKIKGREGIKQRTLRLHG